MAAAKAAKKAAAQVETVDAKTVNFKIRGRKWA